MYKNWNKKEQKQNETNCEELMSRFMLQINIINFINRLKSGWILIS